MHVIVWDGTRVSYRGEGGDLEFFPPSHNFIANIDGTTIITMLNFKISGGRRKFYMLLDISMCHQNVVWTVCPRLHQKQSERI